MCSSVVLGETLRAREFICFLVLWNFPVSFEFIIYFIFCYLYNSIFMYVCKCCKMSWIVRIYSSLCRNHSHFLLSYFLGSLILVKFLFRLLFDSFNHWQKNTHIHIVKKTDIIICLVLFRILKIKQIYFYEYTYKQTNKHLNGDYYYIYYF